MTWSVPSAERFPGARNSGLRGLILPIMPVALGRLQVRLWSANLRAPGWRGFMRTLSEDEQRRADRFEFERDARRYVVSHYALRQVLGQFIQTAPDCIVLVPGRGGKPELVPVHGQRVHFSLSRSRDLALIAVSARPVGVDIEYVDLSFDFEPVVPCIFSHRELLEFNSAAEVSTRAEALFGYWTKKEAFVKATGEGLARPLSEFEIGPLGGGRLSLIFDKTGGSEILGEVASVQVAAGYVAAVATVGGLRRSGGLRLLSSTFSGKVSGELPPGSG